MGLVKVCFDNISQVITLEEQFPIYKSTQKYFWEGVWKFLGNFRLCSRTANHVSLALSGLEISSFPYVLVVSLGNQAAAQ